MKDPNVSPTVAASLICLVLGGAMGYAVQYFTGGNAQATKPAVTAAVGTEVTPAAAPAASGGGGGGWGGGGGGGASSTGGAGLARMVRNLDQIQKAQGKGLTPSQEKAILPLLQQDKSADKLPDDAADKQIAAIQQILTADQKKALEDLQPAARGGGGGRPGGGGGGPPGGFGGGARPRGGPPGGFGGGGARRGGGGGPPGGFGGGGGFGGPPAEPDKPFASDRNKTALDSLIAQVSK